MLTFSKLVGRNSASNVFFFIYSEIRNKDIGFLKEMTYSINFYIDKEYKNIKCKIIPIFFSRINQATKLLQSLNYENQLLKLSHFQM